MVKISQLPSDAALNLTDRVPYVDMAATPQATEYITFQDLITSIFNNVPAGAIPGSVFSYVITGLVISADSAGVNRNATMSAGSIYINSRTIALSTVVARTYTASKDTYVDVLDNLNGTGTLVYTEAPTNAASPALAANSIRIGIVVTGATTIAAAGSVNQGQEDRVLPIASSIPYTVTDSLGNLICPRDPARRILGYHVSSTVFSTATTGSAVDVTAMSVPVIIPAGSRKVQITAFTKSMDSSHAAASVIQLLIRESTTTLAGANFQTAVSGYQQHIEAKAIFTPTAGAHTYKMSVQQTGTGTMDIQADSSNPYYLMVELL